MNKQNLIFEVDLKKLKLFSKNGIKSVKLNKINKIPDNDDSDSVNKIFLPVIWYTIEFNAFGSTRNL